MPFTTLTDIPPLLKGRGAQQSLALEHDCGCKLLWAKIKVADVKCPRCGKIEQLSEDHPIIDGSAK